MMKQRALHSGQGHISLVRWQSLLCQGRMENQWNGPVQSSVPIIWPRSQAEKIWLSRVNRKLWKVPRDSFSETMARQYRISNEAFALQQVWYDSKVHTSRSKIKIWQYVESDQRYLLSGSSAWWLPPLPRAAAASRCTVGRAIDLAEAKDTSCTLKELSTKQWHW